MRTAIVCLFCINAFAAAANAQIMRKLWYESSVDSTSVCLDIVLATSENIELTWGEIGKPPTAVNSPGRTDHYQPCLESLKPATPYWVSVVTTSSTRDSLYFVTSTSSSRESKQAITAYFNKGADRTHVPPLLRANDDADYISLIKGWIAQATSTIDVALYSFSGSSGHSVATALLAAHDRGVQVRVILDSGSSFESQPAKRLTDKDIPVIWNSFGANGETAGNIHHNKFFIFDADIAARASLVTGSWNVSDRQTYDDFQNIVHIEDQSLARAYRLEFNEQWGSSSIAPDPANSRFSAQKYDNTPRRFRIGTSEVRAFFSPNGTATDAIANWISAAERQILFALLSFTRDDIGNAIEARHSSGVDVHGMINNLDQGGEFEPLRLAGVDVLRYPSIEDVQLHHKYAVIDLGLPTASVITGSQNWSTNGEVRNNENTLIIESGELASQYFQEWLARYKEAGGSQTITIPNASASEQTNTGSLQVYPNPSTGNIAVSVNKTSFAKHIRVVDILGRSIREVSLDPSDHGHSIYINDLPPGVYSILSDSDGIALSQRLIIRR